MANFTITVTNSVRCFGAGPASLWNASYAIWGSFNWGEGTQDIPHRITHLISEALASDTGTIKYVQHLISETLPLSGMEIFRKLPAKTISETIAASSEMTSERVLDGSGYYRVFPGETTEAEDRYQPTWTPGSGDTETWTAASATTTTWSDA